ncbi:MAG TPA: hypothetical protein DCQ31_04450 [Bacteroidales bacterium]|nr:hypothetical protein [Bacteroidales bacterium]
MVTGIETFRSFFKQHTANYVIIGGTACDIIIEGNGFVPRATRDIDMILVIEALTNEFVIQFWEFIKTGNYAKREQSTEKRQYYRFMKPENPDFPFQIELFSRNPDLLDLYEDAHLTPIPVGDNISSLSAILMNDTYYTFLIDNSLIINELHFANTQALICTKAKAYLDIAELLKQGIGSKKHLNKHKADVFRMALLLQEDETMELPNEIKADLQNFIIDIKRLLPGNEMFKEMGVAGATSEAILPRIIDYFGLATEDTEISQ